MVISKVIAGTTITAPGTPAYTSNGTNAVTCIALCNTGTPSLTDESANSIDVNIYIVSPDGGGDNTGITSASLVVKQLVIPAGETVFFNDEKFVLINNDYIAVGYQMSNSASPVSNLLTVTVSTIPV